MRANTNAIQIFRVLIFSVLFLAVNAYAQTPIIDSVTSKITANTTTITINGTQLCVADKKQINACKSSPVVTLAGKATTPTSHTPTQVVVTSTIIEAGSYTLRLNIGTGRTFISYGLTIAGLNIPDRGDLNATVSSCQNVPVSAQAYIPGLSVSGYTDEKGDILLKDIPTGNHSLVVEKKADAAINAAKPVEITAGQVTDAGAIILEDLQSDAQNCGMCGKTCLSNQACSAGQCISLPSCNNGIRDGSETGTDCGGGTCPSCAIGVSCAVGSDCTSGKCTSGICSL